MNYFTDKYICLASIVQALETPLLKHRTKQESGDEANDNTEGIFK